jgi:hypothetical protein
VFPSLKKHFFNSVDEHTADEKEKSQGTHDPNTHALTGRQAGVRNTGTKSTIHAVID